MRYIASLLIPAVAAASGWSLVAHLPAGCGHPVSMEVSQAGHVNLVLGEGTGGSGAVIMELTAGSGGAVTVSEEPLPDSSEDAKIFVFGPNDTEGFFQRPCPEFICRLGPEGDTLWRAPLDTLEGDVDIRMVIPSEEGGCIAVLGPSAGNDIWSIHRLGPSGGTSASATFRLQGGPVLGLCDMMETEEGGVLLTGVTDSLGMNLYMFLTGFDSLLSDSFMKLEDIRFHASGKLLEPDGDGAAYVAGYTGFERDDGYFMPPVDRDVFLMKIDYGGNEHWRTILDLPLENVPVLMETMGEGGVLVLVRSFEADGSPQVGPEYSLYLYSP